MIKHALYPRAFSKVIRKIGDILKSGRIFFVGGHVRPDGDCIGSLLAFYFLLKNMGKQARLYTAGPIPEYFRLFPGADKIETSFDKNYPSDVCIFVDCGSRDRVIEGERPPGIFVNIDHHKSNDEFADVNYVDPEATAVGEQIYHIITAMRETVTPDIASSIYLSLLSDTGGFRFSNTDNVTFSVAAEMVKHGADPARIAEMVFENRTPESITIKGKALSDLHYECEGRLVWSEILQDTYKQFGEENEPESLVGELRGVSGVEISILFHEIQEGGMRAGLRSRGALDVSEIAFQMGGGGHANASGCYVKGNYAALRDRLVSFAVEYLEKNKREAR
ncbi:bifunctional oligoribonuclease/PAP phosphatase NrnA [Candidatus Sumerlaeota bacterium]|nr:bifunctional oligoribonuclease/PAP phosphatase NrnA [Candidatus Sumerlaeota bacterium]